MRNHLKEAESKPYMAAVFVKPKDALQYGVPGMKWGQRRTKAQLRAAATTRGDTPSIPKKPDGPESSAARYSRLKAQAKAGLGSQMDDDDLRFFNARTEAIAKVNKLNQTDPGWLSKTSKKVMQQATQKMMQDIVDSVTNKYITIPVTDALGAPSKAAQKAAKKD